MPTVDDLFARILADRRDDALRAAYARAIRAEDPDHAELIDVQLELARLAGRASTDPEVRPLAARARVLLLKLRAPLRAPVDGWVTAATIRRGFVEEVTMTGAAFAEHGEALVARAPVLDLRLTGAKPVFDRVITHAALRGMRSLHLSYNELGDDEAVAIAQSPVLGELRWLDLTGNQIGARGLEALAASTSLGALEVLQFARNATDDPTPDLLEDRGAVHHVESPAAGRALRAAHGDLAWLKPPPTPHPTPQQY